MEKEKDLLKTAHIIGKLAFKHGLITKDDLIHAAEYCEASKNSERAIVEYLLQKNLVSRQDIKRMINMAKALKIRRAEIRFGTIAIEKGFISSSVLQLALDEQKADLVKKKSPGAWAISWSKPACSRLSSAT